MDLGDDQEGVAPMEQEVFIVGHQAATSAARQGAPPAAHARLQRSGGDGQGQEQPPRPRAGEAPPSTSSGQQQRQAHAPSPSKRKSTAPKRLAQVDGLMQQKVEGDEDAGTHGAAAAAATPMHRFALGSVKELQAKYESVFGASPELPMHVALRTSVSGRLAHDQLRVEVVLVDAGGGAAAAAALELPATLCSRIASVGSEKCVWSFVSTGSGLPVLALDMQPSTEVQRLPASGASGSAAPQGAGGAGGSDGRTEEGNDAVKEEQQQAEGSEHGGDDPDKEAQTDGAADRTGAAAPRKSSKNKPKETLTVHPEELDDPLGLADKLPLEVSLRLCVYGQLHDQEHKATLTWKSQRRDVMLLYAKPVGVRDVIQDMAPGLLTSRRLKTGPHMCMAWRLERAGGTQQGAGASGGGSSSGGSKTRPVLTLRLSKPAAHVAEGRGAGASASGEAVETPCSPRLGTPGEAEGRGRKAGSHSGDGGEERGQDEDGDVHAEADGEQPCGKRRKTAAPVDATSVPAGFQRSTEAQEADFKGHILKALLKLNSGACIEDVDRLYSHSYHKRRGAGTQNMDKYYFVKASSDAAFCLKMRSYVEVADYIYSLQQHEGVQQLQTPQAQQQARRRQRKEQQRQSQPQAQQRQYQQRQDEEQERQRDQQQGEAPQAQSQDGREELEQQSAGEAAAAELLALVSDALGAHRAAPGLTTDLQRLHAAAVAAVLGCETLRLPSVQELLLQAPPYLARLLPLLAGNVSVLSDEQLQQVASELRMTGGLCALKAQLLVWAAGAAAAEATGAPLAVGAGGGGGGGGGEASPQEVQRLYAMAPKLEARLPAGEVGNPMRLLLRVLGQVRRHAACAEAAAEMEATCLALAACVAHAQHGRVGEEAQVEGRLSGKLMRLFSVACDGSGGEGGVSGFDALSAAAEAAGEKAGGGAAVGPGSDSAGLPFEVMVAMWEPAVKAAMDELQGGTPRAELEASVHAAGRALLAAKTADLAADPAAGLAAGIAGVLRLVHGGAAGSGLALPAAVAAAAAGCVPGTAAGDLFLKLLQAVRELQDAVRAAS